MEFLWVLWFSTVSRHCSGFKMAQLPKIGFMPRHRWWSFEFLNSWQWDLLMSGRWIMNSTAMTTPAKQAVVAIARIVKLPWWTFSMMISKWQTSIFCHTLHKCLPENNRHSIQYTTDILMCLYLCILPLSQTSLCERASSITFWEISLMLLIISVTQIWWNIW